VLPALMAVRSRARPAKGPRLSIGWDEAGEQVEVALSDLAQHLYVIGATGVGKTTLLSALIRQDIEAGRPVFLVDPHGDLYNEIRDSLPKAARRRTILADVSEFSAPFTLNLLGVGGPHARIQRSFICNQLIAVFKDIYGDNKEAFGPIFETTRCFSSWRPRASRPVSLILTVSSENPSSVAIFSNAAPTPTSSGSGAPSRCGRAERRPLRT